LPGRFCFSSSGASVTAIGIPLRLKAQIEPP
jgi:hypothetical protein